MDERMFQGLPNRVEVAEGARLLMTANLHVESGLMNGTQCTLKEHIWGNGHWPNHPDADKRMPTCLLVEAPDYIGPSFFPEDETRRKWIPLFPITRTDTDTGISRTQFPVILGWAITPWKAQGMTLRRVKVKIGKSVSQAGVLFAALLRVRHPDDMMLDDFSRRCTKSCNRLVTRSSWHDCSGSARCV